jgi:hypothetical protein
MVETRRRNLEMRAAVRSAADVLRRSRQPADIWDAVRDTASALGACSIGLTLVEKGGRGQKLTEYSHGGAALGNGALRARFAVAPERLAEASIELGFDAGRQGIERDTEIAIETLSAHVASAIERLEIPLAGELLEPELELVPVPVVELRRMA